ncbi:MAG TPA: hypothetical protein VFS60_08770 [Thermoanaerobaculia bacterium]|nr:hypothetical protein [Thermoanaerobaculia bacterium]
MATLGPTEFWAFLREVILFAVDDNLEKRLILGDAEVATLTEEVFLESLYAQRQEGRFEQDLASTISSSGPIVCLVGSRGAGKTSVLRYVTKRILGPRLTSTRVIFLDYKSISDQHAGFRGISKVEAVSRFRAILANNLLSQIFPNPRDHRALAAWLLAGPPDQSDSFNPDVVSDLAGVSMEFVAKGCKDDDAPRRQRVTDLTQLFDTFRPDAVAAIHCIMQQIRPAQIVQAAVSLGKAQRLLLVHDNLDRVEGELQPALLEATIDMHVVTADYATTVVAIRRENVKPKQPRPGHDGNFVQQISLSERHTYPAYLIPYEANSGHSEQVLRRRYEWALEQLLKNSPEAAHLLERGDSPARIHERVLGSLIGASVDDLSNGSLRNSILIYLGFWQFLKDLDERHNVEVSELIGLAHESEDDKPEGDRHEIKRAKGHLNTLFFLWLGQFGRDHGVRLYDMMRADESPLRNAAFADVASLHHLSLTCLLNLEKGSNDAPKFRTFYARLADLGYSLSQMKAALSDLAGVAGDIPMAVLFPWKDEPIADLDEDSDERLRLTPMGRRLITDLFGKVGYVWASAFTKLPAAQRDRSKPYWQSSQEERIAFFRDRLRAMARRHLALMVLVRATWEPRYGSGWLVRYREHFAVESQVHVERLLQSSISFYRPEFRRRQEDVFAILLSAYTETLRAIENGTHEDRVDLPEALRERRDERVLAEVFR